MAISKIFDKYSTVSGSTVYYYTFISPLEKIIAVANDTLLMVCFEDSNKIEKQINSVAKNLCCNFVEGKNKILVKFEDELASYLKGNLKKFTVPLTMVGSDFQKDVWKKLIEVPFGSTQTYGDLAKALGRSSSHARAIGAACGANLLILVVPCHRLVASGSKGGFSSGLDRKEWLLDHENKHAL